MLPVLSRLKLHDVLRENWRTPESLDKHRILDNNFQDSFTYIFVCLFQLNTVKFITFCSFVNPMDKVYMLSRKNWATWGTIALRSLKGNSLLSLLPPFQSQHTTSSLDLEEDWGSLIEWPLSMMIFMAQSTIELKHLPSCFDQCV